LNLGGTVEQISLLAQTRTVNPMCALFNTVTDTKTFLKIFDCLEFVLEAADEKDKLEIVALEVRSSGGLDSIIKLQHHPNMEIQSQSVSILEFFEVRLTVV